jgi:peptide deformylase
MVLPIITVPRDSAFLSQISQDIAVESLSTAAMQSFFDDLIETSIAARTPEGWRAAGLSAVQVGKLWRCYSVRMSPEGDLFTVFINPQLELLGNAKETKLESCLSVPGKTGLVPRSKRLRITYLTREGEQRVELFDGFLARILQHEQDHLNGVLYTSKTGKD